mgnify:CR=1 FL=1
MKRLRELAMNQEGFAFDPSTGESYHLNQTAHLIIELLRAGSKEEQIVKKLAESYGIDSRTASEDIHDLLFQLRIHGLTDT